MLYALCSMLYALCSMLYAPLLNGAERLFGLSSGFFTLLPGRRPKSYEPSLPQIP